jgi:hypothetical protein
MEYEIQFLKALALTLVVELLVLFVLFKTIYKETKVSNGLLLLTGVVPSMATLPYLWFIIPLFVHNHLVYMVICELSAVMVEWLIIQGLLRIPYGKALLVSFLCNAISFSIGLLIPLH